MVLEPGCRDGLQSLHHDMSKHVISSQLRMACLRCCDEILLAAAPKVESRR